MKLREEDDRTNRWRALGAAVAVDMSLILITAGHTTDPQWIKSTGLTIAAAGAYRAVRR